MVDVDQDSALQLSQLVGQLQGISIDVGLRLLTAGLMWIAGRWVANSLKHFLKKVMVRAHIEPTLVSFVCNMVFYGVQAFVMLAALGRIGIETTSLVAVLGAAGLAIGLALQGSLANFAAGILIVIFHPFREGDWIEAADITGIVEEIQIFTTILKTRDNRTIVVPNSSLTDGNIINYSTKGCLRVDLVIGVAYEENLGTVKQCVQEVLSNHPLILVDPAPIVGVLELADSCVNLAVRPWTKTENYWDVYFAVQEAVKTRFDEVGISIPYPQRDLRLVASTDLTLTGVGSDRFRHGDGQVPVEV